MRWAWHVACMGCKRNKYRVLVGKPEGRGHLKPNRGWETNIKIDLTEI
jgi:hypothetical protein